MSTYEIEWAVGQWVGRGKAVSDVPQSADVGNWPLKSKNDVKTYRFATEIHINGAEPSAFVRREL